jgi:hypothetical protein
MLSRRTLTHGALCGILGLLLASTLACQNPFAPNRSKRAKREPVPATTAENCIARLDYVMNERDWEKYESLLDDDYWFSEPNDVDSLNFEWGKDVDIWGQEDPYVAGVKKIFEGVESFTFEFEEPQRWTEHGRDYPGEGHDAHPNEDWEVFYGFVRMLMMKPDGDGYRVDQFMTFKLRKSTGTNLWYIIRWIDDPLGAH